MTVSAGRSNAPLHQEDAYGRLAYDHAAVVKTKKNAADLLAHKGFTARPSGFIAKHHDNFISLSCVVYQALPRIC